MNTKNRFVPILVLLAVLGSLTFLFFSARNVSRRHNEVTPSSTHDQAEVKPALAQPANSSGPMVPMETRTLLSANHKEADETKPPAPLKLKDYLGALNSEEMNALSEEMKTIHTIAPHDHLVDFFLLSRFGIDGKTTSSYLGSATFDNLKTAKKMVINNDEIRMHVEADLSVTDKDSLKMDYTVKSGQFYTSENPQVDRHADQVTGMSNTTTYLTKGVPTVLFKSENVTVQQNAAGKTTDQDAIRYIVVAISRGHKTQG